jgi:ribosomal protein L37E
MKKPEHLIKIETEIEAREQYNEIICPSCGSHEFDTQECAECGYSVYGKDLIRVKLSKTEQSKTDNR